MTAVSSITFPAFADELDNKVAEIERAFWAKKRSECLFSGDVAATKLAGGVAVGGAIAKEILTVLKGNPQCPQCIDTKFPILKDAIQNLKYIIANRYGGYSRFRDDSQ